MLTVDSAVAGAFASAFDTAAKPKVPFFAWISKVPLPVGAESKKSWTEQRRQAAVCA